MTGHKYLPMCTDKFGERHALGGGWKEKMEKRKDVKREFECHIFEENGDDGLIECMNVVESVLMGVGRCSAA